MHKYAAGEPIEILLVEDNPGDVYLVKETLHESKVLNRVHVVNNGVDASAFLRREGKYEKAPLPDIILLDLNMPRKDGRELLAEIKADKQFRHIPVVILTSSEEERDIVKTYHLHADSYIIKPVDLRQFILAIMPIEDFAVMIVKKHRGQRPA